jgi:hypothetical protein
VSYPLRRVFEIDALVCGHCGGRRKLIALVTRPDAIRAILAHLGLPLAPIPLAPARPPPEPGLAFE